MKRVGLILAGAGIMAISGCGSSPQSPQYTLQMRPAVPLSAGACIAEARHYGYSPTAGASICAPGQRRRWYRAVLTNAGAYGLPSCAATGFDARGRQVFRGRLFFEIGGITGLFVPAHQAITFYWYLPAQTRSPVARYAASCTPAANPPV
jgi:hypothetical protein